ncbi:PRC-barrel domain-containing protein [Monaibacterium marinum]|uniref:PRC-barrel domain-containing protein n=1 Tax=Pontivivens marinum TaxID=1690039 RepID=A0A2C9CPN5_9RHOB|nr:PRC-barrel domain-containing protein [Monaibacterium marinum]SOH93183.1 PRC-barrel domain-containing protein [Monaibacterium marinum]
MKKFLITTAVALALTTTAHAQSASVEYIQTADDQSLKASDLLGARIYATETNDEITYAPGLETEWDDIGEINDVIVSRDGSIQGVVLGVGGFLGLGEKDVAVSMDDLRFVSDGPEADEWFIVVTTNAEALEAAPSFEFQDDVDAASMDMTTTAALETDTSMNTLAEESSSELSADVEPTTDVTTDLSNMANATGDAINDTGAAISDGVGDATNATGEAVSDTVSNLETSMANAGDALDESIEDTTDATEGFMQADIGSIPQDALMGATVYGSENEDVGEIDAVYETGAVVNVGGFLGLGEKSVLVPLEDMRVMTNPSGEVRIYVDATQEMLEEMPAYEG